MKSLGKGIVFIMFLTGAVCAQAERITVKSMKEIQPKIESILETQKAEDVLVAFDIDMTLTQPDHPAVYYPALKKHLAVYKAVLGQLTREQKDLASTLTTQIVPQRLVEPETSRIIKTIQDKGIKVIALTATLAGQIKDFPDKMIILRRDQLQKMGIDFTKSLKDFVRVSTFFDFKKYAGCYPLFYHGILSTNGEGDASKGDVLIALLRHIDAHYEAKVHKPGYRPKMVVLVDDKKKHLESVEKSLKAYDPSIQFVGIEYRGAELYAPQDISEEDFKEFWEGVAVQAKCSLPK